MHVKMILGSGLMLVLVPAAALIMLLGPPGQVLELETYSFDIVLAEDIPVFCASSSTPEHHALATVRNISSAETHLFLGAVLTEGNRDFFDSLEIEVRDGLKSYYWGPISRLKALPLGTMARDEVRHLTLAVSFLQGDGTAFQDPATEVQFVFSGHPDLMPVTGDNVNGLLVPGLFLVAAAVLLMIVWRR